MDKNYTKKTILHTLSIMKKISVIIALLTITSSTTALAGYTSELQSAYDYAYSISITTQSPIDSANMYGSLIRSHMAKMMVNYAEGVLGKTPDDTLACEFSDVADESSELKGYILEACQLGLMGVGITAFNPNATVTRAQFGTVLSRALYDDAYNGGEPYYTNHLQALKDAGIMTNIAAPSVPEVRGYVMLMMMRAEWWAVENTTSQCDTPENKLLCMVGSLDCPSECQTNEITTIAGTLQISAVSSDIWTLPTSTKYVGSLQVTADQDILIKTLTFQKVGSFTKGWIEDDGVKIASITSLAGDTTITTSFSPGLTIKQWEPKTLSVFIESDSEADQWVTLSNSKNIESSASSISGVFPYRLVR